MRRPPGGAIAALATILLRVLRKDKSIMAFIPAADAVRVDIQYRNVTEQSQNTLWFRFRAGAPTLTDLIALGSAVNDYWSGTIMPALASTLVLLGNVATDWSSDTAPAINTPFVIEGGIATPALPNNVAFCVSFSTAGRGRSSRGRNYVPGIPREVLVDANTVSADFANTIVTGYGGINSSPIDTDWEWSVVSFQTGGAPRVAGLVQPVGFAAATDLTLDSQRRRLPGRGT